MNHWERDLYHPLNRCGEQVNKQSAERLLYIVYSLASSGPVLPKCVIFIGLAYRGARRWRDCDWWWSLVMTIGRWWLGGVPVFLRHRVCLDSPAELSGTEKREKKKSMESWVTAKRKKETPQPAHSSAFAFPSTISLFTCCEFPSSRPWSLVPGIFGHVFFRSRPFGCQCCA
jgi:hypothetical protein